jgi:hypothetical protein
MTTAICFASVVRDPLLDWVSTFFYRRNCAAPSPRSGACAGVLSTFRLRARHLPKGSERSCGLAAQGSQSRCAEDMDGFEDADGCPDPDNDKDGVPDTRDTCPNEAGPPSSNGCPQKFEHIAISDRRSGQRDG